MKGVGQDAYAYFSYVPEGGGWAADVLTSKGVTRVVMREAGGSSATALRVALTIMNRESCNDLARAKTFRISVSNLLFWCAQAR